MAALLLPRLLAGLLLLLPVLCLSAGGSAAGMQIRGVEVSSGRSLLAAAGDGGGDSAKPRKKKLLAGDGGVAEKPAPAKLEKKKKMSVEPSAGNGEEKAAVKVVTKKKVAVLDAGDKAATKAAKKKLVAADAIDAADKAEAKAAKKKLVAADATDTVDKATTAKVSKKKLVAGANPVADGDKAAGKVIKKKAVSPDTSDEKPAKKRTESKGASSSPAAAKAKLQKPKNATAATSAAAIAVDGELGGGDLITEFRDLPARLQEAIIPDIERFSARSHKLIAAANAGIADGARPLLAAAAFAVAAVVLTPFALLAAMIRRLKPRLPLLHRLLLLTQAFFAVYFATLASTAAVTGLEPLRFFHAASPAAYAWGQAAQSLAYIVYLLLQVVDLMAVFSPAASGGVGGDGGRTLGLAQMVVGLAVGLHYYAAVFHRAAAGEAPRTNWRVHAVYAVCFLVVCACARAERRKKAYVIVSGDCEGGAGAGAEDGEDEQLWKKS